MRQQDPGFKIRDQDLKKIIEDSEMQNHSKMRQTLVRFWDQAKIFQDVHFSWGNIQSLPLELHSVIICILSCF